jgi:aspartyl-tRNA(Asn)/glutamyl-tRNA(Gln) amidotransferase subunit C
VIVAFDRARRRGLAVERDVRPVRCEVPPKLAAMPEPIPRSEAEHIARLARLQLSDDELDRLTVELGGILEHVTELASLDLDGVDPTAHPLPLINVLRADEVRPSLDRAEVLAEAPAVEDERFRVPRILDAP